MSNNKKRPFVIAIAAISGGGKSTIVKKLGNTVPDSKSLYFDDYDFHDDDIDLVEFAKENGDYNIWKLDPLVNDVKNYIKKAEYVYIFIDYPFAYLHEVMKKHIDMAVFIDTPFDIALARRLLRDHKDGNASEIMKSIEYYINYGRIAYEMMLDRVMPDSDVVIDGLSKPDSIVDEIIKQLK